MVDAIDLGDVRREYEAEGITRASMADDPIEQFGHWLARARELQLLDATAMTLATVDGHGQPSARVVLLKQFDARGFCWFTDSRSRKGQELAGNPRAALLFHWRDLSRQVRIHGTVEALPADEAESYFNSRPEGSRFSAASSCQSTPTSGRAALEARVAELRDAYPDGDVPRPEAWIGYRLHPEYFEFWQGQDNRLHDRIIYQVDGDGWTLGRLQP